MVYSFSQASITEVENFFTSKLASGHWVVAFLASTLATNVLSTGKHTSAVSVLLHTNLNLPRITGISHLNDGT
jgi:hypothetical protein